MDTSEILRSIRDILKRSEERTAFLIRTYRWTTIAIFLIFSIGLVAWARTGFSLQFGRSRAACDFQFCSEPNPVWNPVTCQCEANFGPSTSPGATSSPNLVPHSPWNYWDYATKSCLVAPDTLVLEAVTAVGSDLDDARCGGPGTSGECRKWSGGDANSWRPGATPATAAACEPLSAINGTTFPGYLDTPIIKPPITFPVDPSKPDCFVIEDRSSNDPNFGEMTGATVPLVLGDKPNARLFMKAFVVNNCPWTVHYVLQVDASKKATFDQGAGKRNCTLTDAENTKLITTKMPDGYDFPSCWNSGNSSTPANCAREISIEFNLNTFTCGSVGITTAIWHRTANNAAGGQNAQAERGGSLQYATVLNWGRDCSGTSTERAPSCGGATGTVGTGSGLPACTATLPAPSKLTVVCGTTQNVLTWTAEKNACTNTVLRSVDGGNAVFVTDPAITATSTTYTDKNIQAGHTYSYRVKNNPAVTSNMVTCTNGVQVAVSPTVSPTVYVQPSPVFSATPVPTGGGTCQGGNGTTGDLDCDGVPNNIECPGYFSGMDITRCPDTNADGVPDVIEPDVQNYGLTPTPVGQSPVGAIGTVQTGPGDATLLALVVSAVVSLAYVSYAHSPTGRRREIEAISKDQNPTDFRS